MNNANLKRGNLQHGHTRTGWQSPTYQVWAGMVKRCSNPRLQAFKYYGGRGIRVCDRWLTFTNFLTDMGERPPDKTLDRIDNDGNYEPGNCRWATRAQQRRNSRYTRMITFRGETLCIADWADRIGVPRSTLWMRLSYGWSVEAAVTTARQPPGSPELRAHLSQAGGTKLRGRRLSPEHRAAIAAGHARRRAARQAADSSTT